jgi:signal peptidase I
MKFSLNKNDNRERDSEPGEDNERSKAGRILNRIASAIIIVIFAVVAVSIVSVAVQYFTGRKPSLFGYRFFYIQTDSMTPDLQVGDVILSKMLQSPEDVKAAVREGDVITYTAEYGDLAGMNITHKVVKGAHYDDNYGREVFTTRGIKAGAMNDPPVPVENVDAVMVKNIKAIGAFYRFITSMEGLLIVIILPFGLILAMLTYRLVMLVRKPARGGVKVRVTQERAKEIEEEIARQAVAEFLAAEEARAGLESAAAYDSEKTVIGSDINSEKMYGKIGTNESDRRLSAEERIKAAAIAEFLTAEQRAKDGGTQP